jgi:hypothetical protein
MDGSHPEAAILSGVMISRSSESQIAHFTVGLLLSSADVVLATICVHAPLDPMVGPRMIQALDSKDLPAMMACLYRT